MPNQKCPVVGYPTLSEAVIQIKVNHKKELRDKTSLPPKLEILKLTHKETKAP